MNVSRTLLTCALLLAGRGSALAAASGAEPFNFLFLDASARASALGGAYTARAADANALHYNPAGLGRVEEYALTFMHSNHFEGINQEYISLATRHGWGLSLNYLSFGDVPRTTVANPSGGIGNAALRDLAVSVGYGRTVHELLSTSTVTVTVINNPTTTPAAPGNANSIGASVDITLSNGQTNLAAGQSAAITITYMDNDGNGFIDGTAIRASELRLYSYDAAAGAWKIEGASSVDGSRRTVTGLTTHFSLFGLFAPSHSDLSAILVYPVPFRPNNADANDGVHFSPGDPNSGIVFDLLPENATVKIYTVTGQLVDKLGAANGGRIHWDVRNRDGKNVASGGYIAVIESGGQAPIVRKLLIIR